MEGDGSQPTQATQNVLDPRRVGKQNSGFSDEDISDIICLLYPHSEFARREVHRIAREHSQHVVGREEADAVEPDYEQEDRADQFQLTPPNIEHAIILRLSAKTKDPLHGFMFGRNASRCDICFANDPMKRLSNIHFRIYVNEYGVVMLEDQSTNGTFVEGTLLRAKPKNANEKCGTKRVLSHGSKIKVLMHNEQHDLEFLVRIPKRVGEYEMAYTTKLQNYFAKLENLRVNHNETVVPGPGGHVDLFAAPRRPPTATTRRIALPSGTTHDNVDRFPRDWDGSGKYNRVGQIGKGAFAVVYKVTSKFDGVPYAAKELEKRRFIKNGILDQKVENEMKIMQRVQHPNIVRYIEHFDWDNRLFIIIMEFVGGGDLGKLISSRGPLHELSVKKMAAQLLSALAHLHENHITHRDVKPDNILISSLNPFDVKLTDFGLSKMVDNEQTFLRTFCGTLLYCAPEVYSEYAEYDDNGHRNPRNRAKRAAVGQRYDHAVDVWSLGGVLFYALTGNPPYPVKNGVSYSELLHTIMTRPLDTLPLVKQGISQQGIEFLCCMLEKRPECRATVRELQTHSWLGVHTLKPSQSGDQSFDEISDEEEELQVNASQLSLEEGQSRYLADTELPFEESVDDIAKDFIEEDSEQEHGTFGPNGQGAGPRLFGEVNRSAIGSRGAVAAERLNLPVADSGVLGNESSGSEIQDSYESEDASTIIGKKSGSSGDARSSVSAAEGQSEDQLRSLVENVASQSLGATDIGSDLQMKSAAASHVNGTFYNASKRKPASVDTSDEYELRPREKPIFKRLKSEGNLDTLAEEEMEEYRLLASVPQIKRLESGRQIDGPFNKMHFWGKDMSTWHLRYPEMTQLQYEMFKKAAQSRGEEFGPGKSPLWEMAFKYFPPNNGVPAMHTQSQPTADETNRALLKRDDRKVLEGTEWDIPATAPPPEEDSLPDTLPPERQHQIIVPVSDDGPKRAVAVLESAPDSLVSGISVPVTISLMSWGRGPSNTVIYEPKTEVKIPKYALKILLWKEGHDPSKDLTKHPWDKYPNGEGFAFYLSTKATNGILLNSCELLSYDCKNPTGPSKNWVQIYDGDEIVVWGTAADTTSQTRVIFRCFYGDSAKHRRPDALPKLVPSSVARKMDEICSRYERKLKTAAEQRQRHSEVDKELFERKQNIERERERSRVFEEKRLEALRFVALRTVSRRGSPASAPATTVLRGQTPGLNAPSPLQEARSSSP